MSWCFPLWLIFLTCFLDLHDCSISRLQFSIRCWYIFKDSSQPFPLSSSGTSLRCNIICKAIKPETSSLVHFSVSLSLFWSPSCIFPFHYCVLILWLCCSLTSLCIRFSQVLSLLPWNSFWLSFQSVKSTSFFLHLEHVCCEFLYGLLRNILCILAVQSPLISQFICSRYSSPNKVGPWLWQVAMWGVW